jgi:tetratricopeptide (TPR) repeat protein
MRLETMAQHRITRDQGRLLSVVLTLGLAWATAAVGQTPSPESYLEQSFRAYQEGRYASSIEAARAALKLRENYPDAWNNIAAAYDALGLWEDGAHAAQEALRLQPDNKLAANNLAWARLNQEATPESCLNQSIVYYQQGKFDESIRAARMALTLRPLYADAWNNIAAAYNAMSQFDQGIHAAEEALRLKPGSQLALNNLAWARERQAKQKSTASQ